MKLQKFKNISIGTPIVFHNKLIKFYKNNAWDLCTVRNLINNEDHAIQFMVRKMLGMNISYWATLLDHSDDVGDGPGGLVEIKFNDELKFNTWVSYKDIKGVIL